MAPPIGFVPWNKGKKGIYSVEVLESNRQKHLGKKLSVEHKQKIALKMQQRKLSEEHKKKIGIKTKERCAGKSFQEMYGLIGAIEKRAKMGANNWTKRLKGNFPQSTLEKKRQNVSGENNPMFGKRGEDAPGWLGGLKLLPYDKAFNKWFKESIRFRDNYCCVKCQMFNEDHKKLFKNQQLQIHHINYNKQLTIPENCCALCCRCNNEVNYNRNAWTTFFQSILLERHGYIYENSFPVIDLNKQQEVSLNG